MGIIQSLALQLMGGLHQTQILHMSPIHHTTGQSGIESFVLSTCELNKKHSAVNLRAHLLKTLQEWEILPPSPTSTETTRTSSADFHIDGVPEIDDDMDTDIQGLFFKINTNLSSVRIHGIISDDILSMPILCTKYLNVVIHYIFFLELTHLAQALLMYRHKRS